MKFLGFEISRAKPKVKVDTKGGSDTWGQIVIEGGNVITVSEEVVMQVAVVYSCVKIISETIATIPFFTYKRLKPTGKERDFNHNLDYIFTTKPNRWMDCVPFKERLQYDLLLNGNAYCEIVRSRRGDILELVPMFPCCMKVSIDKGKKYYTYTGGTEEIRFKAKDVFHIVGFGNNGIVGNSVLGMVRETFRNVLQADAHSNKLLENGGVLGGVLEYPSKLSDDDVKSLRKHWENTHSGSANTGKVAILQQNMKYQQLHMKASDVDLLATRKFDIRQICRIFNVPPHKVMDLEDAHFCLPGDAKISTPNGVKNLIDIKKNDYVWSLGNKGEIVKSKVLGNYHNGKDYLYRIKMGNRTLYCNSKHKILCRKKKEVRDPIINRDKIIWYNDYVRAEDIRPHDVIIINKSLPQNNNAKAPTREVTEGFMAFCGLFLGDGNLGNRYLRITRHPDADYMDYYRNAIKEEFVSFDGGNGRNNNIGVGTKPVHLQETLWNTTFNSTLAVSEIIELGFYNKEKEKRLPDWIFELGRKYKLAFLAGFLDADGSVNKKGRVTFSGVSYHLISRVRYLCIDLGIDVTNIIASKRVSTLPNGKKKPCTLFIFTCSNAFVNSDIPSKTKTYLDRFYDNKAKTFNRKSYKYPNFGGKDFNLKHCALSRVSSIDVTDMYVDVYDLEVEKTHNFIADGVVVHNSNIESQQTQWVVDTIRPLAVRWEDAVKSQLHTYLETEKTHKSEFLVDGLLRGDPKTRGEVQALGRQWGTLSSNDIRAMNNQNPIDGGDDYLVPANMVTADYPQLKKEALEQDMKMKEDGVDTGKSLVDDNPPSAGSWKTTVNSKENISEKRLIKSYSPIVTNIVGRYTRRLQKKIISLRDNCDNIDSFMGQFDTYVEQKERSKIEGEVGIVFKSFEICLDKKEGELGNISKTFVKGYEQETREVVSELMSNFDNKERFVNYCNQGLVAVAESFFDSHFVNLFEGEKNAE